MFSVFPARTARILLMISVPGQIVFVFVADLIYNNGSLGATAAFVCSYIGVGLLQLMLLLYIGHLMIHTMWRYKIDPDNSSIPYLTALGDLLGTTLLLLAFMFLRYINQDYSPLSLPLDDDKFRPT